MKVALALSLSLVAAACGPDNRDPNNPGGPDGGNPGGDGANTENCSDDAKLIYVVDSDNTLSKFDPTTKQFTDLGQLDCPAAGAATPFSMGIDRNANAYVLYVEPDTSSQLFKVDTKTLACSATGWTTQLNLREFGMGFSTNAAGGSDDTLYIAGAATAGAGSVTLASVDVNTFAAMGRGTVQGSPELTGTGNAELWGFFPETANPRVAQLDKTTGQAIKTYNAPSLAGEPEAWAFAFYGGDFFIFLSKDLELSTTVYQMNGTTGAITGMTSTGGRLIVGAGVSTCAPTVIL